jgi:competence protein ComEC
MLHFARLYSLFFYTPPLLWLSCAYIGGILLIYFFQSTIALSLISSLLCIFTLVIFKIIKDLRPYLILLLIGPSFFCGGILYKQQINSYKQFLKQIHMQPINCTVTINDINTIDHPRFRNLVSATIENAQFTKTETSVATTKQSLLIYTAQHVPFCVGDSILLKNIKIKDAVSSSLLQFFIKEGVAGTIVADFDTAKLIKRPKTSLSRFIYEKKINNFRMLQKKLSHSSFTFFSSFFLGNRKINKKENDELKYQCKYWGISHYLARSGLHLVIFIMVWEYILRFLPIFFLLKQALLIVITLIYFIFTWNSISFFRAFLTFMLYKLYLFKNVQIHTLHAIILITLIVLVANPAQLFFLDFQLSFGITLLLAWINHFKKVMRTGQLQNSSFNASH